MINRITIYVEDTVIRVNIRVFPRLNDTGYLMRRKVVNEIGIELDRLGKLTAPNRILQDWEYLDAVLRGVYDLRLTVTPLPPGTDIIVGIEYPRLDYDEEFFVKETETVRDLKMQIIGSDEFNSCRTDEEAEIDPKDILLQRILLNTKEPIFMYDEDFPLSKYCIYWGCIITMELFIVREVEETK